MYLFKRLCPLVFSESYIFKQFLNRFNIFKKLWKVDSMTFTLPSTEPKLKNTPFKRDFYLSCFLNDVKISKCSGRKTLWPLSFKLAFRKKMNHPIGGFYLGPVSTDFKLAPLSPFFQLSANSRPFR